MQQTTKWILFLVLLLSAGLSQAQGLKTITGTVRDSEGMGLPGVNVLIKGTNNGTATDVEGKYSLSAQENEVIVFSFVGYLSEEVTVGANNTLNVTLMPDIKRLSEIVVVGYGTQQKGSITTAITSVKGEELSKITVADVGSALQGKAAGVSVVGAGTEPGTAPKIFIRGISTINGNDPLYVVDGLPVANINFLNPKDIQSMDVLKDASAAAIYGSRAANGVILITTKSGKKGEPVFSLDVTYGSANAIRKPKMASASEYAQIMNVAATNSGKSPVYANPASFTQTTDWWDEISRTGNTQNYSLGLSGGTDKVVYSTGLSYFKDQGIIKGTDFDRVSLRLKTEYQPTKRLKIGQDINLSVTSQNYLNNGGVFRDAINDDPITPARVPGRSANPYDNYGASPTDIGNPLAVIERNFDKRKQYFLVGNLYANYEFIDGLVFETRFGTNNNVYSRNNFNPYYSIDGNEYSLVNSVVREHNLEFNWNNTNTLTYKKNLGNHNLTALAGLTFEKFTTQTQSASGQGIPSNDPSLQYPDAATTGFLGRGNDYVNTIASMIGRVNYDFKGRYFLSASVRRDGASVFPTANRWGVFPSVSAGWLVSDENFFKGLTAINYFKLRAGWGRVGNQNIRSLSNSAYVATLQQVYYVTGDDRTERLGVTASNVPNQNVKWETVEDFNIGTDLAFLSNKLTVTADFFRRNTIDMLMGQNIPAHAGYGYLTPITNVGTMTTNGFDFSVGYKQDEGEFTYGINLNATRAFSKIKKLANGEALYSGNSAVFGRPSKTEEGGYVGAFYGYVTNGIFQNEGEVSSYRNAQGQQLQADAKPGDFRFADLNNDGVIDSKDQQFIGNPMPDLTLGLNLTAAYKGFDLTVFFTGSVGNDVVNAMKAWTYSGSSNYNKVAGLLNEAWHGEGTSNSVPRIVADDNNRNLTRFSNFYVEDGSYARLRNLQLGYTFTPQLVNALKMKSVRLYVSAQNLLTFTKYTGLDPEIAYGKTYTDQASALNRGVDLGNYPTTRTFLVGANISF